MHENEEKAVQKTALQEANEAISQHCFEAGRLHFEILLDEETLEKKKLRFKNMQVDFEKLRKTFLREQDSALARAKSAQAAPQDGLEMRQ